MVAPFTIPMFGRIDGFWVIVAIVAISSVWEWLKKQRQGGRAGSRRGESDPLTPPPPVTAPRPAATSDWEEELRRLLGGESPVVKPPPAVAPPIRPIIIREANPISSPRPAAAAASVGRTIPPPLAGPGIKAAEMAVDVRPPSLHESAVAYHRASHLHEGVAEHLKRVEEMTEHHRGAVPIVQRTGFSTETIQAISLIRNPRTTRQAVIASLIFGPPKALDTE